MTAECILLLRSGLKSAYTIKNAGSKFAFVRRSFVDIAVAIEP